MYELWPAKLNNKAFVLVDHILTVESYEPLASLFSSNKVKAKIVSVCPFNVISTKGSLLNWKKKFNKIFDFNII